MYCSLYTVVYSGVTNELSPTLATREHILFFYIAEKYEPKTIIKAVKYHNIHSKKNIIIPVKKITIKIAKI